MNYNKNNLAETLKRLCMQTGVSGFESICGISDYIYNEVKLINAETSIDKHGNVISIIGKKEKPRARIFLEAHMDEFGFISTKMQNGIYEIEARGDLAKIERIENDRAFIVRSLEHGSIKNGRFVLDGETRSISTHNSPMVISFARSFDISTDGIVRASALDDRVGCAVLIEIMKCLQRGNLEDDQLTFMFSVNEETKTSKWDIGDDFDFGIVIDAAYAQPISFDGYAGRISIPMIGSGCAIQYYGKGFSIKEQYIEKIKKIANSEYIQVQDEIPPKDNGYTNFALLSGQCRNNGVVINIPVRDQHRAISTTSLDDVTSAVKLISALISRKIWEVR